ncbi:MAG: phosphoribosylformylglycinamidine synthase subunit PurL, partial [Planctomycetota bacterium]
MIWRVDVFARSGHRDVLGESARAVLEEYGVSGIRKMAGSRVYLVQGSGNARAFSAAAGRLLADPVVEECRVGRASSPPPVDPESKVLLVFKRAGVMDPVEASARKAFADSGVPVEAVRTGIRYEVRGTVKTEELRAAAAKLLANEVVDEIHVGERPFKTLSIDSSYEFRLLGYDFLNAPDRDLVEIGKKMVLSLNLEELHAVRDYFREIGRNPTDIELETIAQTWSEHCKHKTIMSDIVRGREKISNLLRSTIVRATKTVDRPWCVSVFKDNAGIIEFDDVSNICFKVETHNHPSAIEPYGGANTGIGGVIRDVLGCGLGARPVASTDVFCVGPPDLPEDRVPPGSIHPRRLLRGVVEGVRDYGNRMGIPTVNGGVFCDERYTGNPLVYCGTVGIMPKKASFKEVKPGDLVLAVGGRTGRDGIHGATFSSAALTEESEAVSGSAVQIGNAIVEKQVLDTILQARDRGLYRSITDCGAGGFSSAVGEMGEACGAKVDLEKVPLKYEGLSYSEIWISEAQERMVLAVPPEKIEEILKVFRAEDVEATVIGKFTDDRVLTVRYNGKTVLSLDMEFLHHGLPRVTRTVAYTPSPRPDPEVRGKKNYDNELLRILSSWNVCSKEWIVRQYDHEVQGGSVVKPLTGAFNDGPGDAAVLRPDLTTWRGLAIGCGMNPLYGDIDTYAMAASAIDEAVRNVVSVGGDPGHTAILDNFAWGSVDEGTALGALVRACEGCADTAIAFGTPFISGKDSLNNMYEVGGERRSIPHSLLISAVSVVRDVRSCVTMDLKAARDAVFLVGTTKPELGGSHFLRLMGETGSTVPTVDTELAPRIVRAVADAIGAGLVRACHDLSEGGLAAAAAEMAFAGNLGMEVELAAVP